MTAPQCIVTVEHDGNLAIIRRHPVEPPRPPMLSRPAPGTPPGEEEVSVHARRRARLAVCWYRSKLRRDLADAGIILGFAVAALICVALWPDQIGRLMHVLFGGE